MKSKIFLLSVLGILSLLRAQDEPIAEPAPYAKFKFLFTYGITVVNPEQINDGIANTNYTLNSEAKSIKSVPEFGVTLSVRPQNDFKVLVLRAGYASVERVFTLSVPQTSTGTVPIGIITGDITETYAFTPISFGIGATDQRSENQFQIEFIYATSTITEKGTYRLTSGERISTSRELTSPAYGIRAAGHVTLRLTPTAGISMELGYRYLVFDEYEDAKAARYNFLEFPVNGVTAAAGFCFTL